MRWQRCRPLWKITNGVTKQMKMKKRVFPPRKAWIAPYCPSVNWDDLCGSKRATSLSTWRWARCCGHCGLGMLLCPRALRAGRAMVQGPRLCRTPVRPPWIRCKGVMLFSPMTYHLVPDCGYPVCPSSASSGLQSMFWSAGLLTHVAVLSCCGAPWSSIPQPGYIRRWKPSSQLDWRSRRFCYHLCTIFQNTSLKVERAISNWHSVF